MDSEMVKKKGLVLQHIVANRLSQEEAAKYAAEQGVAIRCFSFTRVTDPEQYESGQRFVGDASLLNQANEEAK